MTIETNDILTMWPDGYVQANGIQLHYWRTGDGSKPILVLCHGFSDNGLCWVSVAQALENAYDLVMVDARGHGLSDAPESGYTTADRADDVAGVVQALGLDSPAIMGHSMGASTAAAAAAAYPQLFSKVLLEDPAWFEEGTRRQAMNEQEREAWLKRRREEIIERKKMSKEALIALCHEQSPTWPEAELEPWALSKQQLSPNVVGGPGGRHDKPWREVAAEITAPTLLITADTEKGSIVTQEIAKEAHEINPKIEAVLIEGVGHNIRREAFEAYMKAVKDFLAK